MLITLVAIICNGVLCVEKPITNSDQSGMDLMTCQVQGQMGIAQWLNANPQYRDWTVKGYRCVPGTYVPRREV
jgi:hypothetical protein